MKATVTQLDRMLYAWLAESDNRKFDLAFKRYYAEASPSLVRYLTRRSSLNDLDCEQIAVDALLKFFCRVGRDRRKAAESVAEALPRIQPLNFGPFHVRQVQRWTSETASFVQTSMSFALATEEDLERAWKAEIQTLADHVPPLQRQGCHLLESARTAVGAASNAETAADPVDGALEVIREFAVGLRSAAEAGAPAASAAESQHPGVTSFVDGTWTVVDGLPLLRVPTNGYLFDIAQSLYLDECKARGRKKRGGSGAAGEAVPMPAAFALDYAESFEDDADGAYSSTADPVGLSGSSAALAANFADEQIDEDFCEQFYAYLRKPLEDAEEAFREASATGKANAERKRLESLGQKNERLMSVLTMRIEGRTQEAIAETLGVSRNQVKYIIELVQSGYQQFCASALRNTRR